MYRVNSKLFFSLFVFISIIFVEKNIIAQDNIYVLVADEMPKPVGGLKALYQHIEFPQVAKKAGVNGKVFLQAFINEKGEVDYVKIIKGIGSGCDEAAIDGVKACKFEPAATKGVNVKARLSMVINF